jgi:hypothetical protein
VAAQSWPKQIDVVLVVLFLGWLSSANPLFVGFLVSLRHLLTFREGYGGWWRGKRESNGEPLNFGTFELQRGVFKKK